MLHNFITFFNFFSNLLILTEKKFQINGKEWKGNNLLGKLLTKLRDEKLKELK